MRVSVLVLLFLVSFNFLFASPSDNPINNRNKFCNQFSTNFNKQQFIASFLDQKNRLAFTNKGGLFDIGVCWWHSRFLRAAAYLTYYEPQKPKPKESEVDKIIHAIVTQSQVVAIPGFSNLEEFSNYHNRKIQAALEDWQLKDSISGAVNRTLNPLRPSFHNYNDDLLQTFFRLHDLINQEKVVPFVIEQNIGTVAHAYLVVKSEILGEEIWNRKIRLTLVDSNSLKLSEVTIDRDSNDRIYFDENKIEGHAIYIDYFRDLFKVETAIKDFCPHRNIKIAPQNVYKYEY